MQIEADLKPKAEFGLRVIRGSKPIWPTELDTRTIARLGYPQRGLSEEVNDWRSDNVKRSPWLRGIRDHYVAELAKKVGLAHIEGLLFGKVIRADGEELDLGLMGLNIVTSAGATFIADAFRNSVEAEIMKYHGIGTGSTSETTGDTALVTELTTQLNPDSTRATGTLAGSSNTYTTVATNTVDSGVTLREWGLFSQAGTGGGTMFDRVTYAAVGLSSGDSLQTTFSATFPAGG